MRWFKHFNDLLDKPEMQLILDKHGPVATDAFIRLMEYTARNFDVEMPGIYNASLRDFCSKVFPLCGKNKAKKILETFQNHGILKFTILGHSKNEILLEFPEIKNLADEYTIKILKDRKEKCRE
jgi:hypothetical protein